MSPSAESTRLAAFYQDHQGWLKNLLFRRAGCRELAADLAQDTFVRLLVRRQDPRSIAAPRAFLTTIARGLILNHWRRQALEKAYREWLAIQPEAVLPSQEEQALVMESLTRLAEMLEGLPRRSREVFVLSRLDGLSYQQIAVQLGITVNMVQKAMILAMRQCYGMLYGIDT